jgi:hypothetical protein
MAKKVQNRAKSVDDVMRYKPHLLGFTGDWLNSFGEPELRGCWLVWGGSGNGKTRFALQLCKYLATFGRVAYNSLEEGLSLSLQTAIAAVGMQEVARRFVVLDKEPMGELIKRLNAQKSPDVVVIDSLQYSGLNKDTAKELVDGFPRKLFVFISHADGRQPSGRTASAVRFHANVKVLVEGYRAFPVSRYGGGAPYTVWAEGASKFWGQ